MSLVLISHESRIMELIHIRIGCRLVEHSLVSEELDSTSIIPDENEVHYKECQDT